MVFDVATRIKSAKIGSRQAAASFPSFLRRSSSEKIRAIKAYRRRHCPNNPSHTQNPSDPTNLPPCTARRKKPARTVTAVTAQRRRLFKVTANAELLQSTLLDYHAQNRFLLHAFVVMPDHIHAILTPAPEVSLEKAMQYIKGGFSFRLKSKRDVWERSFNESQILSPDKFRAGLRYVEDNPVRRGLAASPQDYPYSSARWPNADPIPAHLR